MKQSVKKLAATFVFAASLAATSTGAFASWQTRELRHIEERNRYRLNELSKPSTRGYYQDSIIRNMRIDNDRADRLRRSLKY